MSALALKGDRKKGKALRALPLVSHERAKTVVERERKKRTRIFPPVSGAKSVRRKRKIRATERYGGKGVSLTIPEFSRRLAWKQESTGEFVKRQTTEQPQNNRSTEAKNTDTITNPALLVTNETNTKTDIGCGDVSTSVEPANSAPRD